jgi:hypothetical protein
MDTAAWLAAGLVDFRDPGPPTQELEQALLGAFTTDFSGGELVREVAQRVAALSSGHATLVTEGPGAFPFGVRGPAAYLRLVRDQLLVLQPAVPPVLWIA